eukprot:11201946-Lingulodinium_polyedra.AAC.1
MPLPTPPAVPCQCPLRSADPDLSSQLFRARPSQGSHRPPTSKPQWQGGPVTSSGLRCLAELCRRSGFLARGRAHL